MGSRAADNVEQVMPQIATASLDSVFYDTHDEGIEVHPGRTC